MGWSNGTSVMDAVIKEIKKYVVNKDDRMTIYDNIWKVLEDMDWDCPEECLGDDEAFDKLFESYYPDYYENYKRR